MKKQIIAVLLLLSVLFAVVSCREHIPSVDPSGSGIGGETEGSSGSAGTESNDGAPFVITVMAGGSPYIPDMSLPEEDALQVRLTDGKTYHTEKLGADGKVEIDGLDGDYTVTLLNVPTGYTYNPNIYTVGNDKKTLSIELLTIIKTYGNGSDMYSNTINLSKTGVYRANIRKENQVVYYEFQPKQAGRYCFESMIDISAEMYNPKAEIYTGSFAYWLYNETLDGGGVSGEYTKNFRHIVEVDEKFAGHSSYLIGIKVEGKDAVYPTYVDFSISYLGTYSEEDTLDSTMIRPTFIPGSNVGGKRNDNGFLEWREELYEHLDADKAIHGSDNYIDAALRVDGKRVFDQRAYKLNPDDGLYHRYDLEEYASTNGWGPILYADITVNYMFAQGTDYPSAFNVVEYNGNKALTLCEGTVNYKLFIEGYDVLSVTQPGQNGSYFCNSDCPCYEAYKENKPNNNGGMCAIEENCTECKATCRHLPAEFKYQKGYANIVNEDGRAPVTEELKLFLQRYSESQRFFADGYGWVETYEPRYDGYEDSQWLFACGFYY